MEIDSVKVQQQLEESRGFSVVCLARESPEVLKRFLDYYCNLGAEVVFIYLDEPCSDEWLSFAAKFPAQRIRFTYCDCDYWTNLLGKDTNILHLKQEAVYVLAQKECSSTWLFITDSDEYVIPHCAVSAVLDRMPSSVDAFGLPPAEAIWGPGDDLDHQFGSTWFRRPFKSKLLWKMLSFVLYGSLRSCFTRNHLGHVSGKHFIRSAAEFDLIGNHRSMRREKSVTLSLSSIFAGEWTLEVAHFDAISFPRWPEKFSRRVSSETLVPKMRNARQRQIALISEALNSHSSDRSRQLFAQLYSLNSFKIFLLKPFGRAFKLKLFDV